MDYRNLLLKYMAHVEAASGQQWLLPSHMSAPASKPMITFTPEEIAELEKLDEETNALWQRQAESG